MSSLLFRAAAVSALVLSLAGCNRNTSENASQPDQTAATAPAAPTAAPAPAPEQKPEIPPGTELAVNAVNSVMLSRPGDTPNAIVIRVSGFTVSPGWTDPKLTPEEDTGGAAGVRTYKLVATSPQMPQAGAEQPVVVELRIDMLPPEVTTIRIVSATNEVAAPVAQ
mgnify:CR=1 FL=1